MLLCAASTRRPPEATSTLPPDASQPAHRSDVAPAGPCILVAAEPRMADHLMEVVAPAGPVRRAVGSDELELQLRRGGVALVVCAAQLSGSSGLQSLARARASGDKTPFVIVRNVQGASYNLLVSDSSGAVLSSRVLDAQNFATLVGTLAGTTPSSRRPR